MNSLLTQVRSALDGVPAEALLDDCLHASTLGQAAALRAQLLADHILAQWVAAIEVDLAHFPLSTLDVLQQIQRRMVEMRNALLQLRWLLHDLAGQTVDEEPESSAQSEFCPAGPADAQRQPTQPRVARIALPAGVRLDQAG